MLPGDRQRWRGKEIWIILGLGNPLILPLVEEFLKPGQICVVIDPREDLGQFLCQETELLRSTLERPGSHLFFGESMLEAFFSYLDSLPAEGITGARTIHHSPTRALFQEFFTGVEGRITRTIQGRLSDLLTRFEFEKRWIRNILENATFFPDRSMEPASPPVDLAPFSGALRGFPAVLVSAGPSLKESLPLLQKLQNRAFLLAADTACKVLLKNGITPHGVVTLDAQAHSQQHFLGEDLSRTVLFSDIVAHPPLLRQVRPWRLLFSTTARFVAGVDGQVRRETTAGTGSLEKFYGTVAHLQSGGSVATTAFDLLRFLEADPVLLVGQDLAYTGRKIHSTGTHHNERWLPSLNRLRTLESINEGVIRKRDTHYVPALEGPDVLTDYVLNLYRHWFEESIPGSGLRVFNLTAKGACIKGCLRPEDPDRFVEALPERSDFLQIFASVPQAHRRPHLWNRKLKEDLKAASDGIISPETFFEIHPDLEPLARRARVYAKRNMEKLGEKKAREVYEKRVREDFLELNRRLRFPETPGDL